MSSALIQTERGVLPVKRACRSRKVSASGYYTWQKRQGQAYKLNPDKELVAPITPVFEKSRGAASA